MRTVSTFNPLNRRRDGRRRKFYRALRSLPRITSWDKTNKNIGFSFYLPSDGKHFAFESRQKRRTSVILLALDMHRDKVSDPITSYCICTSHLLPPVMRELRQQRVHHPKYCRNRCHLKSDSSKTDIKRSKQKIANRDKLKELWMNYESNLIPADRVRNVIHVYAKKDESRDGKRCHLGQFQRRVTRRLRSSCEQYRISPLVGQPEWYLCGVVGDKYENGISEQKLQSPSSYFQRQYMLGRHG